MTQQFWDEPKLGKEMTAAELIGFVDEIRGNVLPNAKVRVRITFGGGIQRIEVDPTKMVKPLPSKRDTSS